MIQKRNSAPVPPAEKFDFQAGTGVIRAKIGTDFVTMYYGRLALPGFGQCYIDGTSAKSDAEMKLNIKAASDRRVVATLVLPRGEMPDREGKIVELGTPKAGDKPAKRGRTWKVRAVIRNTDGLYRLVLRLPEVKISQPASF